MKNRVKIRTLKKRKNVSECDSEFDIEGFIKHLKKLFEDASIKCDIEVTEFEVSESEIDSLISFLKERKQLR
ncbi:MAG: hypothetical protein ACPLXL_01665 [Minisyncoccia bacterium]